MAAKPRSRVLLVDDSAVVRKLLGEGRSIPPELSADADRPLKDLLSAV